MRRLTKDQKLLLKKYMIKKLFKYFLGGITNTLVSYLIYCFFLIFFNYKISYLLSLIISIFYIYQINIKFVFKINLNKKRSFFFFLIYFFQILSSIFLLDFWIKIMSINELLAPILNILIISPLFFYISNSLSNKYNNKVINKNLF